MPDDIYARYMRASTAWTAHRARCTACQLDQRCLPGIRLYEQFVGLQDKYLALLRARD